MNTSQKNKKEMNESFTENNVGTKKKKTRYFETYILKKLKNISKKNGITSNAKQQLNSIICSITQKICMLTLKLTSIANKKTVSVKEVKNAVFVMFNGDLAKNSVMEGISAVDKYNSHDETVKGVSRHDKASIIFPPAITDRFIRNGENGYTKIMITADAPVFMASVLEYLTGEILIMACTLSNDNKRVRITIRDLELSVRNDIELNKLFIDHNLKFLGGGVVPFIHESLLVKKPRKNIRKNLDETKKVHRFRPGTVALRDIRKYQKASNVLTFAKCPFERIVRSFVKEKSPGMKISKDVFSVLQHYIEQYLIDILQEANLAAIHAGRVKLMNTDLVFVLSLRNKMLDNHMDSLPYDAPIEEEEEEIETEEELSDNCYHV